MKNLVENFKHFLVEAKEVYIAELLVRAESTTKLYGRVFEAIRGIEGVTVIRSTEKIEKDVRGDKIMKLSVRFYVEPGNAITYLEKLKEKIKTIRDEEGDRITSVSIRRLPEKAEDFN